MLLQAPRNSRALLVSALADPSLGGWLDKTLDGVGVSDVLISSAQVLALNATPVIAVPAPGAGNYLEFLGAQLFLDYNSAAYVAGAGEDLVFKYTDDSGAAVSNALDGSLFTGTADALANAYPLNAAASTLATAENAPIVLHLLVGEWATGDSPIKVRTFFRKIEKTSLEGISTAAVAAA